MTMTIGRVLTRISLAGALIVLMWVSRVTISFSAMCPKCLQYAHGLKKSVLGIPYYYRLRPSQSHRGLASPDVFTDRVPPVDPKLYEKIWGKPCKHDYRKLGFCRYSFAMVACGVGRASRSDPELRAMEQIYRAYARIEDKLLAQQSLGLVNELAEFIPSDAMKWRELEAFGKGLGLTSSRAEWVDLIVKGRSGELLREGQ